MNNHSETAALPEPRRADGRRFADWPLAFKSILGFWLVYYLTVVARAFLSHDPGTILLNRSYTLLIGVVLTVGIYAAFTWFAHRASLKRLILVGVLVSFIAAATQAGLLIAAGLAIGGAIAWGFSGTVSAFLFQLDGGDLRVLAAAIAVLAATGLVASALPARRAARVDPLRALRAD
jgi:ABC-type lipoprotein release transport system permease subunit